MKTDTSGSNDNCCDEKVVEIDGDEMKSTCAEGDMHYYTVAAEATVTCDGQPGDLEDIEEGSTVRITKCKDDHSKILAIECGEHIPELATR